MSTYLSNLVNKRKEERDRARSMASEGAILVICEEGAYRFLVDGFKYSAHTIYERKGTDEYIVHKSRDGGPSTMGKTFRGFFETVDNMQRDFKHVMIVEDRDSITTIRTDDFMGTLSDWYHSKRGYFTGKKFGL